jgi:hypothetical protein
MGFAFTRTSPTFAYTQPLENSLKFLQTQHQKILQRFHCLLPQIANVACDPSIPSSNHINHFLMLVSPKSTQSRTKLYCNDYFSCSLHLEVFLHAPECFRSSRVSFLLKHPTLSLVYVAPTHKTNCSTGNLIQATNVNYTSLYTPHSTNQVAHVELELMFLVITSSNTHLYAKLALKIWFVTDFAQALAPFLSTAGYVPPNSTVKSSHNFTSLLTLTLVPLTSLSTHIQPPHQTQHTDALSQLSVLISLSVAYLLSLPLILLLQIFYKLLQPMLTHI